LHRHFFLFYYLIFLLFQHEANLNFFPAIKCLPISIGNANYSTTLAGNIALGKCDDLYYGSPTLYCDLTGYWNQTITGNLCSGTSFYFYLFSFLLLFYLFSFFLFLFYFLFLFSLLISPENSKPK